MARLPVVSGNEAIRAFQGSGWRRARQRGDHVILVKAGVPANLSVPYDMRGDIMNIKELLLKEMEGFSEPLLEQVLDFVRFLKTKASKEKLSTAIISESALKKDWLIPEEDRAWQDL